MYFLYFSLICYSIIVTVNTYVLLAADLNDFRSIAKKFVPETLADQIEDMVQDKSYKYREDRRDDEETERTAEYSEEMQSQIQIDRSFEATTERQFNYQKPPPKVYPKQNRFQLKSAPPIQPLVAATPFVAPPGLSLDDIVEKVKQRLQTELLNRNAKAQAQALNAQAQNVQALNAQLQITPGFAQPTISPPIYSNRLKKNLKLTQAETPVQNPIYETPVNVVKEEVQYEATYEEPEDKFEKPKPQYQGMDIQSEPIIQPAVDVNTNKNRYPSPQHAGVVKKVRYVKQVVVPKPIQRQPQIQMVRQVQQPKLMQRQKQQSNRLAPQKVLKKKQKNRILKQKTPQTSATANVEAVNENLESIPSPAGGIFEAVDMIKSNDSYEDYVTPPKEEAFESEVEETVPAPVVTYKNKATTKSQTIPTFAIDIEPLAEEAEATIAQDGAVEYEDEAPETTTEPKAKTESISYEEKETIADPNATTIAEVTIKGKTTKKVKMGTMIPTREFYKQSSPNYYAKLPTVAEKYNFDEPIPEADREPENLKPIGPPPASINGKVILV